MTRIPELLVPAGGMEQLKAAVACGADAVYLGGASFSARAHADNFTEKELEEAVNYAHLYGVSVHVAMNTLLTEAELPEALLFAAKAYRLGADAVIVQDQGLFEQIHQQLPKLSLHLSTQGTVIDSRGVQNAVERGASRVILARELSLQEIRKIADKKGDTEIEIFVHGAICIGLSGQCHLSGTIGGRSGNRGDCAQPCRMNYTLAGAEGGGMCSGYHLSPKDMCLLEHLEEIAEIGVDSIKIEGRMKSPEYVAAVTGIYRKHLDRIREGRTEENRRDLKSDLAVLRQVYSRGMFTDTYLKGSAGQELMSGSSPKHQGIFIGKMQAFHKKNGHAVVDLTESLSVGDGVEILGKKGTADNVVTYIRGDRSGVLKKTEAGMTVEIGDLRLRKGMPEKGAPVYRLRSKELSQTLKQQSGEVPQNIPVVFYLTAEEGKALRLEGEISAGKRSFRMTAESEEILETARSGVIDSEKLKERLVRTGGTPYYCSEAVLRIESSPFIPVSLMNDLRRQVLSGLTEQRMTAGRPSAEDAKEAEEQCRIMAAALGEKKKGILPAGRVSGLQTEDNGGIQLYFQETEEIEHRVRELLRRWCSEARDKKGDGSLIFCFPLAFMLKNQNLLTAEQDETDDRNVSSEENIHILRAEPGSIFHEIAESGSFFDVVLPLELSRTSLWEKTENLLKLACRLKGFRAVMIANAGQLPLVKEIGCRFETDGAMNILNSEAASVWLKEEAQSVCVSSEPDFLESVVSGSIASNWCIPVYGRLPVMYLEHCPIGSHKSKLWKTEKSREIRDEYGKNAPCCSRKKKQYYCRKDRWCLKDRTGASFPVKADPECCRAVVFSHDQRDRTGGVPAMRKRGASLFRISVMDESADVIWNILRKVEKR